MNQDYITTKQAALILNKTEDYVRKLKQLGRLSSVKQKKKAYNFSTGKHDRNVTINLYNMQEILSLCKR